MKNRDVLNVLGREGDNQAVVCEVPYWAYFQNHDRLPTLH
jgi:hypothetical protein